MLNDHRQKMLDVLQEEQQPEDSLTEVLLSLRVNALQIPPEQRRTFVEHLIDVDMLKVKESRDVAFCMDMLQRQSHGLKHALSALVSVIASTPQGIEYLTPKRSDGRPNLDLVERIIELAQSSEDGSVTQRFQIACLQKLSAQNSSNLEWSVTEDIIDLMFK